MKGTAEVFFTIVKEGQISKDLFTVLEFIDNRKIFSSIRDVIVHAVYISENDEVKQRLIQKTKNIIFSNLVQEQFYKVYSSDHTITSIDSLLYYRDKINWNDKKTIIPIKYTIKIDPDDEGDEVENTEKLEFIVIRDIKTRRHQYKICSLNESPIYYIYEDNS